MHFLEWNCMNFDFNFTEVCSWGLINNILALVQIMAWHQPGDKPLSEPMMVRLPTQICVTRPQWVKWPFPYWVQWGVVITWSNITRYCMNYCNDWSRIEIWVEVHKRPYLALMGELWGAICEDLRENWRGYNGTTLYFSLPYSKARLFLTTIHMGQVTKLRLSCYLVLLSIDSKTR